MANSEPSDSVLGLAGAADRQLDVEWNALQDPRYAGLAGRQDDRPTRGLLAP